MIRRKKTHGKTGTPEYRAWANMLTRCRNPQGDPLGNYYVRGITVCHRWRKFEHFYEDMGDRPSPKHSLDRINNNGHYEPGNCKWSTRSEQQNNTRHNHYLTHDGITLTLTEWADRIGMSLFTLSQRVNGYKWTVHEALTVPLGSRRRL